MLLRDALGAGSPNSLPAPLHVTGRKSPNGREGKGLGRSSADPAVRYRVDNGSVDRRLAALRPSIADQVQFERLSESLARPTPPPKPVELLMERPGRAAFLRQAEQIQTEAEADNARNGALGEAIWSQV